MKAKRILVTLTLSVICASSNAQTPSFQWARRVASTTNPDSELAIGLAIDSAANLHVTGWFDGTNDFGGAVLTSRGGGGQDIFVAKYNASGELQWARSAGSATTFEDEGRGIGVDANGNVYVTGGFRGDAEFGTNVVSAPLNTAFFLAKYDSAGTIQWVRQSVANDKVYGTSLAVDHAGNCYAVGYVNNGQVVSFGTKNLLSSYSTGYGTFLVKYDNAGQAQWAQIMDSPQRCYASSVAVDDSGSAYVPASFNTSVKIGITQLTTTGGRDGMLTKFNSAGVLQWAQQLTGASDCGGFAVSAGARVHLVGGFGNAAGDTVSLGPTITLTNLGGGVSGTGIGDGFLADYASDSGAVQWAVRVGGTNLDAFTGVSSDREGNVYVGGASGGTGIPAGFNVVVAKYDTNGVAQWEQSSNGTNGALAFAGPVLDTSGDCYVAGWFQTNVTFGEHTLAGNGYWSFFLAKLGFSPLVLGITWSNSMPWLSVSGETGSRFTLEYVPALTVSNNWQGFLTNTLSSTPFTIPDTNTAGSSTRFYRARLSEPQQ